MAQQFRIRFWGVRGSYPTPGPGTIRYGGNTACVEIQAGAHTLVFDAGSGIIRLGQELMKRHEREELRLSLFITHAHSDHLIGFPFFVPLFNPHTTIHLFGPTLAGQDTEQLMTTVMSPPYFPVDVRQLPSRRTYHTITDKQSVIWKHEDAEPEIKRASGHSLNSKTPDLRVVAKFTQSHPLDGALSYRIEYAGRRVVYATDVEWGKGYDPGFLEFAHDADILIHDAQYTTLDYQQTKHGFGHSTVEMATSAAQAAGVRELILFHHEPTYSDDQLDRMEAEAKACFTHTRSAREGMEIDLLAEKD
jgi:phosphoribosyl 1,2-cyclic phosphodiesterase